MRVAKKKQKNFTLMQVCQVLVLLGANISSGTFEGLAAAGKPSSPTSSAFILEGRGPLTRRRPAVDPPVKRRCVDTATGSEPSVLRGANCSSAAAWGTESVSFLPHAAAGFNLVEMPGGANGCKGRLLGCCSPSVVKYAGLLIFSELKKVLDERWNFFKLSKPVQNPWLTL